MFACKDLTIVHIEYSLLRVLLDWHAFDDLNREIRWPPELVLRYELLAQDVQVTEEAQTSLSVQIYCPDHPGQQCETCVSVFKILNREHLLNFS